MTYFCFSEKALTAASSKLLEGDSSVCVVGRGVAFAHTEY